MEINVGDYVRFKKETYVDYLICKIVKIDYNASFQFCCTRPLVYFDKIDSIYLDELKEMITKHSKDIIDLVENKDEAIIEYINEFNKTTTRKAFIDIKNDFIVFKTTYETLKYYIPTKEWFHFNSCDDFYKFKPATNPVIKSILTHEQFESNAYKIEKEDKYGYIPRNTRKK